MSDLRAFVKQVIRDMIKTEYPYVSRPACAAAKVTRAIPGEERHGYTLRILDMNGNEDPKVPEIPSVMSDGIYTEGDKVVVVYVNGQTPFIVGRWDQ